jgi:hypothetical protein
MAPRCAIPKPKGKIVEIPKNDYIRKVLDAYHRTPETSGTLRRNDRLLAAALYDRGVPLSAVENALILASARRIARPLHWPPLQPIRSLYYVLPVLDEVLHVDVTQDYYRDLQLKIDQAVNLKKWRSQLPDRG